MAEGRSNKTLIVAVLLLVAALIVVFVLWQQDQESEDVNIDIGSADGNWPSEVGSSAIVLAPQSVRFTEAEAVG